MIAWLGTVINTSECIIFETDRRIQSLTEDLLYLLASEGSLYQVRKLGAQTVVWYTDNQNVARIVNIGSKVPALRKMALDIHRGCLSRSISIDMQRIPRDFNFLPTTLGRWWTTTTTRLTIRFSLLLTSVGVGTPTIDLPAITTRSVRHSIPGSTSLGHPVSTPLLKTGPRPITGSAFLFVWH